MKKFFSLISSGAVISFGFLMYYSDRLSNNAAWSLIISGVNRSGWELYKPFALAYILFILIELSYLRPSLLRFVCDKITGLLALCAMSLTLGTICGYLPPCFADAGLIASAVVSVSSAEFLSYRLYKKQIRSDWFAVPLLVAFAAMIFLLIVLTFYPPHLLPFFDRLSGIYGRPAFL